MRFNHLASMKNVAAIFVVLLLLLSIVFLVLAYFAEKPVDISATIGCLGGNTCFVGQLLKIDLGFNHNYGLSGVQNKSVLVSSEAIESQENPLIAPIDNQKTFTIPLKTTLKEGRYKISFTTDVVIIGNSFQRMLLWVRHLFQKEYRKTIEIEVRYPVVKIEIDREDYKCDRKNNFQQIKEVTLKLEEPLLNEMMCKIRIKTNKLVTTKHPLLNESDLSSEYHYYESNFSIINKLNLMGSIQNVVLDADPAIQQMSTNLIPVCLIDGNEVVIEKYTRGLGKCSVNDNSFWN